MKKLLFLFLLIPLLYGCRGGGSSSKSYSPSFQQTDYSYSLSDDYSYEDLVENFSSSSNEGLSSSLAESDHHLNPEPATALLFGVSLLGWAGYNLRKRRNVFKKK
ncbi:MAG: hypothetical protein B6D55_02875 [Candidatus Omnitrophica bacterium 4484_70.2]|nr:MAG: hypothetical protein B6D55_02875 [Candidatus Omnitrophica bacterium 4484_70.2]